MVDSWTETTLGSVITLQRGFDITRNEQRPGVVPVVSSGGISSYNNEAMDPGPGVVMGRKGTLGRVFYLPGPYWPHDTTLWVRDFKGNDPRFTYYFLKTLDFSAFDVGSANPTLNRNHVHPMRVYWPNQLVEQRSIAEVLGALDDKIAANTGLIATIDELARGLFKLAARGERDRIDLGEIADVTRGVSYRGADLRESRTALVSLKCIGRDGNYTERGLKPFVGAYREAQIVNPGEIVVAQTDLTQAAEVVGRAVRVPRPQDFEVLVASLDLVIARPRGWASVEFLLGVLREERFRDFCRSHTSGTTVLHMKVDALRSYQAPSLNAAARRSYSERIRALHNLMDSMRAENAKLDRLRDVLLPHLMSGRLRVRDAEKQVGEVV